MRGLKQFIKLLLLVPFLITVMASHATASPSITSVVVQSESSSTSSAEVYFQGTPTFTVFRSLDGVDWGTALLTTFTGTYFVDTGLDNYVNYYYKVIDQSGDHAIATAYPPNNNVHSSISRDTSLCAACHVTHAAEGAVLLIQSSVVGQCTTCHDGTQSKYDVRNGMVRLKNGYGRTSGGPFGPLNGSLPVELAVYGGTVSKSVYPVPQLPTSIHNVGIGINVAPGGVSDRMDSLTCVDCHDPHGVTGNFRNLKSKIKVTVGKSLDINFQAFAKSDPLGTSGYGEDITYNSGSIWFCSSCHSDYNQPAGSGSVSASTTQSTGLPLSVHAQGKFIHPVNTPLIFRGEYYVSSLPLESGTGVNVVVCLTCHHAHGTFKTGINKTINSSALIRLDGQGVCEECHKK